MSWWLAARQGVRTAVCEFMAVLGQGDGTSLLIARLEKAESWDEGWNYKGMSQFNRSVSWMDSYVIALGSARAIAASTEPLAACADLCFRFLSRTRRSTRYG